MTAGSQQLRIWRCAIRDGATLEEACAATGNIISPAEGRLYLAADAKSPPPPEAYHLLYDPQQRKESDMGNPAFKDEDGGGPVTGEYHRPDVALAFEIYDNELAGKKARMAEIKGDMADPHKRIKDDAHFPRKVLDFIISLEDMEESKRDHNLLALSEGLRHRRLFLPRDLVTLANGEDGGSAIPTGERKRPALATINGGKTPDFEEMSEAELAAQDGRKTDEEGDDD